MRHAIANPPAVFIVHLNWDDEARNGAEILATVKSIKDVLHLSDLCASIKAPSKVKPYRLCAVVGRHRGHYEAMVYAPKVGWTSLNDSEIKVVGDGKWYEVMRKCKAECLELTTLFYVHGV